MNKESISSSLPVKNSHTFDKTMQIGESCNCNSQFKNKVHAENICYVIQAKGKKILMSNNSMLEHATGSIIFFIRDSINKNAKKHTRVHRLYTKSTKQKIKTREQKLLPQPQPSQSMKSIMCVYCCPPMYTLTHT